MKEKSEKGIATSMVAVIVVVIVVVSVGVYFLIQGPPGGGGPPGSSDVGGGAWDNLGLVASAPAEAQISNAPYIDSAACFLGSIAMLLNHDNENLTLGKICELSNVEVQGEEFLIDGAPMMGPPSVMTVLQRLGYTAYIGFGGDELERFHLPWTQKVPSGYAKKFSTQAEAFDYLKRAVASNRLPMVVVNYNYIMKVLEPGCSDLDFPEHFMVVTGYDENHVYLNDPCIGTDPHENQQIPVQNFLNAWTQRQMEGAGFPALYGFFLIEKA